MGESPEHPAEHPGDQPLDLLLEARPKDGPGKGLVRVKSTEYLPWLVVLMAVGLMAALLAAQLQLGAATLRMEIISSLVVLLITAAVCWHKLGRAKDYNNKFVFSNPEDVVGFVHFDDAGISFGTPKVQQVQYAWVYFSGYAFRGEALRLIAGGTRMIVNLSRASDAQRAELRAGLARVFARPRIGPPIHIRDCLGCGYDLAGSPGPDCPECGRPFHKLNYPDTRMTDLIEQTTTE